MRFMTLCTGGGGFDLGLESAGMECVGQCEIDRRCWPTLEKRWSNVPRTEDVESNETAELVQRVQPDLIAFGFPCQDLSIAGSRSGLAGERSGLFFRCATLISICRPSWLVVENVTGLLSSDGGRDMGTVLGTLGQLGYRWAYRVLDAQYFGVPQGRRRVFIVAHLGDGADPAEILFDAASMCGDSPKSQETAADVARCLMASPSGSRYDPDTENLIACDQGDETAGVPFATYPNQTVIAYQCHGSSVGPMGTLMTDHRGVPFVIQNRASAEKLSSGPRGKGYREGVAYTLEAGQPQSIVYKSQVRRLTPIECERLMGWPDNHTIGSDAARYRMCGNGVVAPVAEWIGRRIVEASQG